MAVFVSDEQSTTPVEIDRLRRLATYVLEQEEVPEAMEMSVLCVGRDAMTALNHRHMGKDGPTDVLAFPMDLPGEPLPGEPALLGDVVLCPQVAAEQAQGREHDPQTELEMLLVHGILHLLGHDHAEPDQRDAMFSRTDRLLAGFRAGDA